MLIAASRRPTLDPGVALRSRLTGFAGFLRANGFGVGGGDSARVLATAAQVGILDRQILRWSLKALLCGRGDEWRRFDPLFDAYFLPPNKKVFVEGASPRRRERPAGGRRATTNEPAAAPARKAPATTTPARHARGEPRRIPGVDGFSRVEPGRARARHRGADAPLRAAPEAPAPAPRSALIVAAGSTCRARSGRAWPAAARRCRWRLEGPPPHAPAPRAAARREPLDEPLQLLLPAPGARAVRRAGRRALLHLPHPHHRRGRGAARPRPVALAGTAAPDGRGLGRRHADRRMPARFQPRPRAAPACIRAPP